MSIARQSYPSDVSDDAWTFVAPYFTLLSEDALQRKHDLCEVYNGLRWLAPVLHRRAMAHAAA